MTARTRIRQAVQTAYAAIPSIKQIYIGRRRTIPEASLPALVIYIEAEEKQLETLTPSPIYTRTITLITEIHARNQDPQQLEELLDTLCSARENALLADPTLGGLATDLRFISDTYDLTQDGQTPSSIAETSDQIEYTD